MAEKKKTGIVQLRYIDDIHAIDVFIVIQQCNSWVIGTGSIGMSFHTTRYKNYNGLID
jgi:hypothetical protein